MNTKILNLLKITNNEIKSAGEVFTPFELVNEMLDKLPEEVWGDKTLKWLEPAGGFGVFIIAVYSRLMKGLKEVIKCENKREKWIKEHMLYYNEYNEKNVEVYKLIMNPTDKIKLNIHHGDYLTLDTKEYWGVEKFDIIIGNPPYNAAFNPNSNSASPLYHKFIEKGIDNCCILLYIVPSKWFYGGGKGLDKFKKCMLKRKDIQFIKHFDNGSDIFGNDVEIKGGVNYFMKNSYYTGKCNYNGNEIDLSEYDILVDSKFCDLVNNIDYSKCINEIYKSCGYYRVESNDKRMKNSKTMDNDIKCFFSQLKGFEKYIEYDLKKEQKMWKVITTEVAHKGYSGFGNTFIGKPEEICNGSYIFFHVNNENEANSLISYMSCKLPNVLLSIRKPTHHISKSTLNWVPLPPLDRIWDDDSIFNYYNISCKNIDLVKKIDIKYFCKKVLINE